VQFNADRSIILIFFRVFLQFIKNDATGRLVYTRMFFVSCNFVSSLFFTLKPDKPRSFFQEARFF